MSLSNANILDDYRNWASLQQRDKVAARCPSMQLGGFVVNSSDMLVDSDDVEKQLTRFNPELGWVTRQSLQLWREGARWHASTNPDRALTDSEVEVQGNPILAAELLNAQGESWRCQWLGHGWQVSVLADAPEATTHIVCNTSRLLQRTNTRNSTREQHYRCYISWKPERGFVTEAALMLPREGGAA